MKKTIKLLQKHPWVLLIAAAPLVLVLIWGLGAAPARADLSGFSEVSTLDIFYTPGNSLVEARVHLVVGVALMHQAQSEQESKKLLEIAQIFSHKGTRLYVELEKDKIKSFQISVH